MRLVQTIKVFAVVLALMVTALPAMAADEATSEITEQFEVTSDVQMSSKQGAQVQAAAASSTWQYTVYLKMISVLGATDWNYAHRITWTGNGSTISMYSPEDWSAYKAAGWGWVDTADGPTTSYSSGGIAYKEKQTNGRYYLGINGVITIDCDPYIRSKVGANSFHSTLASNRNC